MQDTQERILLNTLRRLKKKNIRIEIFVMQ